MSVILDYQLAPWGRTCWKAFPGSQIVLPDGSWITEVRFAYEPPAGNARTAVTVQVIRQADLTIKVKAPDPRVRWGYIRVAKDGGAEIVGDATLFIDDLTEQYEQERVRQLVENNPC